MTTQASDNEQEAERQRLMDLAVPGPDLESAGWIKSHISIIGYACLSNTIQIIIIIVVIAILCFLVQRWNVLRMPVDQSLMNIFFSTVQPANSSTQSAGGPSDLVDWLMRLQSVLGIGTLLVAINVWYNEIYEDWENSLPKRMSVFFLRQGKPAIVCRYIWLAGEADLRAWGQQVAAQAVNGRLDFYPNVRAEDPKLMKWTDGSICRHYAVCFDLMENDADSDNKNNPNDQKNMPKNPFLKVYPGQCRYQNLASGSNMVFSVPLKELKLKLNPSALPFNWP